MATEGERYEGISAKLAPDLRTALREAVEFIEEMCDEGFLAERDTYDELPRWRALLPPPAAVPQQERTEHAHGPLQHAHYTVPGTEHDHTEGRA